MSDEKTVNYRLRDALASTTAWIVLVVFTTATAVLNVWAAIIGKQNVWLHGLVPLIVLAAALFVEMVALSTAGRWTKVSVIALTGFVFATVLGLSYVGVLRVLEAEYRPAEGSAEQYLVYGGAAVPDALMIAASLALVGLRVGAVRRGDVVEDTDTKVPSRWKRIADAATDRVEAKLAVPETPQLERVVEARGGSAEVSVEAGGASAKSSVEPAVEVSPPSVEPAAKMSVEPVQPAMKPELEPFMEAASWMVETSVVARKTAEEIAEVIAAVEGGMTDNAVKAAGIASASTATKVRAAWRQWQAEREPTLTAVG